MADLNQNQWREKLEKDNDAVIIDVRTDEEIAEGYIPGAQKINVQDSVAFYEKAQKLDPNKNYYIYCHAGGRSALACAILNSVGIENTYNLLGGICEWEGEIITD